VIDPSGSTDPAASAEQVKDEHDPAAIAVGGRLAGSVATTSRVVVPVAPALSVTVNLTVYGPGLTKVWLLVGPVEVPPSPHVQA
jgi:hypothetical protein